MSRRARLLVLCLADLFPRTALWLRPALERRGRARQAAMQRERLAPRG